MKQVIHLDAIEAINIAKKHPCRDHIALYDMAGFVADAKTLRKQKATGWYDGQSFETAIAYAEQGNLSLVEASDKLMSELESLVFATQQYETVDSVCGNYVNVPVMLAGIPTHMQYCEQSPSESSPMSIFVDLTTSAGITAEDLRKRGIAILALVRMLSSMRPLEVWAMTGLGDENNADYCCVRLDTAPLDLARATHMLTSACVARGLGYQLCHKVGSESRGMWPYGYNVDLQRKHGAAILSRVVYPGSEVLFIPPMYVSDELVTKPVEWIKRMLAQYGGQTFVQDD